MMYLQHFGMQQAPFGLTPNTAFYVELPTHQQAMEVLQVALAQGEGFIKVTGEVGTGKTLLCRKLLQEAPAHWALAGMFATGLGSDFCLLRDFQSIIDLNA